MLTKEENDLVTQTGPGTSGGRLLRSYWTPAALGEELPPGGPPIPVRLFSEDLVMFRDEDGHVGLLDLHCSHRATDLSYGRIEDGGLRCVYHGWLYDVNGKCLQTPAEPPGSHLKDFVRHKAYPCIEKGGLIFTYMGEGEPPLLPNYEVLAAPDDRRLTTKYFHECNYLQGLEGSHDPTHVPFLHRFLRTESGTKARDAFPGEAPKGEEMSYRDLPPKPKYWGAVRVEETDFSVWDFNSDGQGGPSYIYPSFALTGGGSQAAGDGYMLYWRGPAGGRHHWLYALSFKRSGPIPEEHRHNRSFGIMTPDYHFIRNQSNRYMQDHEEQRTSTFTGIGSVFVVADAMSNETQGPIQDRTKEMLGAADMPIATWRRMLLSAMKAMEEGAEAPGRIHDPRVNAVDPLFLKRNAPPTTDELDTILAETGGRWVKELVGQGAR